MAWQARLKTIAVQSLAVAEKDIRSQLRYKLSYLSGSLISPLLSVGFFGTIFAGFISTGAAPGGGIRYDNIVIYVILGALSASLFTFGLGAFSIRLLEEKHTDAIRGLLAAPLSPWSLVIGIGLSEQVRFSILLGAFLSVGYFFFPTDPVSFFITLFLLLALYGVALSVGLLKGVLSLVNENVGPLFDYFLLGATYLSCFYYPASFLPGFLRPLVFINPVYYAVTAVRATWQGGPIPYLDVAVVAAALVVSLLASTRIFTRVWRNSDISTA